VELLIFYDAVNEAIKIFIFFSYIFYIYSGENIKVDLLM